MKNVMGSLFICAIIFFQTAWSEVRYERERNNEATEANIFKPEQVLEGELKQGDTDNFLWKLSKKKSKWSWDISVNLLSQGEATFELSKVSYKKAGFSTVSFSKNAKELKDKEVILSRKINAQYPLHISHLLLKKGKYLLTLQNEGHQHIRYNMKLTSNIGVDAHLNSDASLQYPWGISSNSKMKLFVIDKNEAWFSFKIDKKDTQKLWCITTITSFHEKPKVVLYDVNKTPIGSIEIDEEGKGKLEDMELKEGTYFVQYLSKKKGIKFGIRVYTTGSIPLETEEQEPNDSWKSPNTVKVGKNIHAKIGDTKEDNKTDVIDYFRLNFPNNYMDKCMDVQMHSPGKKLTVKLHKEGTGILLERNDDSNYTFSSLCLDRHARYQLSVEGEIRTDYTIVFSSPYEQNTSKEREPNGTPNLATLMNNDKYIEGVFEGTEQDCFKFDVDVRNRLWNIEANASGIETMHVYENKDLLAQTEELINKQLKLSNLFFTLGTHYVCIKGTKSAYKLQVHAKKVSDLDLAKNEHFEHEPNNDKWHTNRLNLNETVKGIFESKKNEDFFEFTLHNDTYIRLYTQAPKDGDARIKLTGPIKTKRSYPNIGEPSVIEGRFPAGRYVVDLWSEKPSMNPYRLVLESKNYFAATDIEPNDAYTTASMIPLHGHIYGTASKDDKDYYLLPLIRNEVNLTISGMKEKEDIRIYPNDKDDRLPLEWNATTKNYSITLKPSLEHYALYIDNGIGRYNYHLRFSDRNSTEQILKHVHISTAKSKLQVQSYDPSGQIVPIRLTLLSSKTVGLHLKTHSSDAQWYIVCPEHTVVLGAEENKSIMCKLYVPKRVSEETRYITFHVEDNKTEAYTHTTVEVEARNRHYGWEHYHDWDVPERLLGGINLARTDIGARIIEEHNTSAQHTKRLYDGLVHRDKTFYLYVHDKHRKKDENVTVKLATDEGASILGTCLDTLGGHHRTHLKDFTLWLSMDGTHFTEALRAKHEKPNEQQCFILPDPQKARYAKLTLHTNQYNQTTKDISLGEWEVIADPSEAKLSQPLNIAEPNLGGHVIWSSHYLSRDWDRDALWDKNKIEKREREKNEEELSFVVGFQNERAAKITDLIWQESDKSKRETRLGDATIEVSTQTPFGPWKQVGTWERNSTLDKNETCYHFATATWARYVKFTLNYPKGRIFYPPEKLSVFEDEPNENYYSIFGKWNTKSHRAFYEMKEEKEVTLSKNYIKGNENQQHALLLEDNQSVQGSVSVAQHEEDWYRIKIAEGSNMLTLYAEDKEGVDVVFELYDENHSILVPDQIKQEPTLHSYTYRILPGNYNLKVYQPPVNVIFAWDHSGSVSPYSSQIAIAVNHYVGTIKEGVDAVNLLCFDDPDVFLLSELRDEVEVVERVFNDFNWNCDGSNADQSLKNASLALKKETGIKGVIIIGDADGYRDMALWNVLREVQPKVFPIRVVSSYDDRKFEGEMQSWTRVNNGDYHIVRNTSQMTQAIDNAVHTLRKPVSYTLRTEQHHTKPLGKGLLRVTIPPKTKQQQHSKALAIELILDASGSMLKRIKGKRRISIAKEVLKHTVTRAIPQGTLTVLRVFGHKEADSCRSDIEIPMQPLNPYRAIRKIDRIMAKNLAKTPIASSLAKVATDLKGFKGKKVVILVTDGEETCDGNPAEEIQHLKASGIDVRINIVGFAINDNALKEQFKQWAALGDGEYFEAHDKNSLNEAMQKALQISYRVYDISNNLVSIGKVGDTGVELEGGYYSVILDSVPPAMLKKVLLKGEETTTIKIREVKK